MTDESTAFTVPAKNLGGRPRAAIDLTTVERAASIGCPVDEIAALLGIGRSTLYDHTEVGGPYYDQAVVDAIEKGRATGKATIRRMQWEKMSAGDSAMLIWLGKVILGQRDTSAVVLTGANGGPVQSVSATVTIPANDPIEAARVYQKLMQGD